MKGEPGGRIKVNLMSSSLSYTWPCLKGFLFGISYRPGILVTVSQLLFVGSVSISPSLSLYVYVCACTCKYVCICVREDDSGGQRLTLVVFSITPPTYFLRCDLPLNLHSTNLVRLTGQWIPGICLFLPLVLGLKMYTAMPLAFFVDVRDLNPGPQACVVSTLATEPSPSFEFLLER